MVLGHTRRGCIGQAVGLASLLGQFIPGLLQHGLGQGLWAGQWAGGLVVAKGVAQAQQFGLKLFALAGRHLIPAQALLQ